MILLSSEKLFPIDIRYCEVKFKNGMEGIVIIENDDDEKKYIGQIKELKTQWRTPNWKEHTDVIRGATIWDEFNGERTIDFRTYRSLVLENFLKAWDIVDEKGTPVPCNKENIGKLERNVAHALQTAFIDKSVPSEDELKN